MTTLERQNVRAALIAAGFTRLSTSEELPLSDQTDDGHGRYSEVWRIGNDNSHIIIRWDKKTYDVPNEIENIITAFENAAAGAVGYVGAANYAERQTEAEARVAKAALLAKSRLKALFGKVK